MLRFSARTVRWQFLYRVRRLIRRSSIRRSIRRSSIRRSCIRSWFRGPKLRNSFPRAEVFIQGIRCCLWHWGPQGFPAINFAVHLRLCGVHSNGWGDIPPTLVLRMPSVSFVLTNSVAQACGRGGGLAAALPRSPDLLALFALSFFIGILGFPRVGAVLRTFGIRFVRRVTLWSLS